MILDASMTFFCLERLDLPNQRGVAMPSSQCGNDQSNDWPQPNPAEVLLASGGLPVTAASPPRPRRSAPNGLDSPPMDRGLPAFGGGTASN